MNEVEVNGSRTDLLATKSVLSSSSTSKRLAQLHHLEHSLKAKGTSVHSKAVQLLRVSSAIEDHLA